LGRQVGTPKLGRQVGTPSWDATKLGRHQKTITIKKNSPHTTTQLDKKKFYNYKKKFITIKKIYNYKKKFITIKNFITIKKYKTIKN
jgi:hypothetical protein